MGTQAFDMGFGYGARRAEEARQQKQLMSDEERQGLSAQIMQGISQGRTKLATLAPGSPEYTELSGKLSQAESEWNNLYHPARNHNPAKAFEELHDLFSQRLLHKAPPTQPARIVSNNDATPATPASTVPGMNGTPMTTPALPAFEASKTVTPAPPRNAAEARQRTNEFLAQFLIDTAAEPVNPYMQYRKQLQQALPHMSEEDLDKATAIHAGALPKPVEPKEEVWTPDGAAYAGPDGKPMQNFKNKAGEVEAREAPAGTPVGPKVSTSKYAQDKLAYAQSLGKKPEQLTFKEIGDFERQEWRNNNPLGPARFSLSQRSENFRESQGDLKDYLTILKAQAPLDRIINTAQEAEQDVSNPTGPGDVALTLAFFDAIKTQGVRFTKQEQDFITGSRGFMDGVQAKFDNGFSGTVFSPDQRKLIAGVVKKAADAAKQQKGAMTQGAGYFRGKVAAALNQGQSAQAPAKTNGFRWDDHPKVQP